jgi:hypothetical protein
MDQISTVFNEDILKNHFSVKRYDFIMHYGQTSWEKSGVISDPASASESITNLPA